VTLKFATVNTCHHGYWIGCQQLQLALDTARVRTPDLPAKPTAFGYDAAALSARHHCEPPKGLMSQPLREQRRYDAQLTPELHLQRCGR
jgi:hypothetical protein